MDLLSHRALQKAIEESAGLTSMKNLDDHIREIVAPFRMPYAGALDGLLVDMQKQVQFHEDILRPFQIPEDLNACLAASIASVVPASTPSFLEAMRRHQERTDYFAVNFARTQAESQRLLGSIEQNILGVLSPETWARWPLHAEIERMMATVDARTAALPSLAATIEGMRTTFALDSQGLQAAMASSAAATLRAIGYASAALDRTDDPHRIRALEHAIGLGDAQFRATAELVCDLREHDDDGEVVLPPQRRLLIPNRERIELQQRRVVVADLDLEAVPAILPTAQQHALTCELLSLITAIDRRRMEAAEAPIFSSSHRVRDIFGQLPLALAVDRVTFGDLIDNLYQLLYEGAGSDNLRYHQRNSGPLSDADCEIVFVIKHLRNYLRHDPERGNPGEVRRKQRQLADALKARSFTELPSAPAGFRRLQRVLMEETVAFARRLRDRL